MKKFLIATNIMLLAIILFQACSNKKYFPNTGTNTNKPNSFCEDSSCYTNDGTELTGMIHYQLAKRMAEDYGNDDGKKFVWNDHTQTNIPDSRTIWFDLKKIKNFIGFIESTLCKDSCFKTDNYGIRMYYAKYPGGKEMQDLSDLIGVPMEYANHHTLFMVPTFWDSVRKMNIDFDPMAKVTNCRLKPMDSTTKDVYAPFVMMSGSVSREQNHGSLMPPPAGAGSLPTPQN